MNQVIGKDCLLGSTSSAAQLRGQLLSGGAASIEGGEMLLFELSEAAMEELLTSVDCC